MPFTITGRDQLGTIKDRLYIIFLGTLNLQALSAGKWEEKLAPV